MNFFGYFRTGSMHQAAKTLAIICVAMFLLLKSGAAFATDHASAFGTYPGYAGPSYEGLTTKSLYITMRDGVKIAIDLNLPQGLADGAKIPTIVKSTRYWRAVDYRPPVSWFQGPEEFERFFTSHGYAVIYIDARGSGASFGTRPHPWSPDEIMDGKDLVDWIIEQPWSNGKVGAIGTSYSGSTAEFFAVPNHPAVKAVIPRFTEFDVYVDIAFPGGIPTEWFLKTWAYYNNRLDSNIVPKEAGLLGRLSVRGVKPVDSDKDRRLLKEAVAGHADNADVYELATAITYRDDPGNETGVTVDDFSPHSYEQDTGRLGVGLYSWGSWFDASQGNAVIRRFLNYSNPKRTVIGPWSHGGHDHASPYLPADTPTDPSEEGQRLEALRFFDFYIKDADDGAMPENTLIYYTVGEEKWKSTTVWPPAGSAMQRWHMAENNSLSPKAPTADSGSDEYTVDFEATTGVTNRWHTQMGGDVIYPDRAEADSRLLVYTSPPLREDTEITGTPIVNLYASSTQTDGAFFVYLEDVDESGVVTYLTEGVLRAIHRKVSDDQPPYKMLVPYHSFKRKDGAPLVPGETAEITFGLHPISVLIKKGHRIRVAIAGADKDTFARIPAEGLPTIEIERNMKHASFIDLPVIAGDE